MDPLVEKAIEDANIICTRAIETTPPEYRPYLVMIKQNKRVGGTRQNPIFAPIQLPYMKVDGRIKQAQDEHKVAGEKINMRTEFLTLEGFAICQTTITSTMHGETQGSAQIHFGGTGVDATSALENAETSAWGRALGAMGYGLIGTGLASADEVLAAIEHGERTTVQPERGERSSRERNADLAKRMRDNAPDDIPDTSHTRQDRPASEKQRNYLITLLEGNGVAMGDAEDLLKTAIPKGLTSPVASKWIEDIREMQMIPNPLFGSYVNMLMKKQGLQKEAVDLYLTTYLEKSDIYDLDAKQRAQLIGWITMAHEDELI